MSPSVPHLVAPSSDSFRTSEFSTTDNSEHALQCINPTLLHNAASDNSAISGSQYSRRPVLPYIPAPSPLQHVHCFHSTRDETATTSFTSTTGLPSHNVTQKDELSTHPPQAIERMRIRLVSSFVIFFLCGWADGVTGTVLPVLKHEFHLSYMTSSLLFVASAVGFGAGTLLIETVTRFLGHFSYSSPSRLLPFIRWPSWLNKGAETSTAINQNTGQSMLQARYLTLICGSIVHGCFFIIMGTCRSFAYLLVAYVISSFGRSFLLASLNAFVASTPKRPMGYTLGFLSTGAFVAPLVCQSLMAAGVPWYRFYLGSLIVSAINLSFLSFAFRPTKTELHRERIFPPVDSSSLSHRSSVAEKDAESGLVPSTNNASSNEVGNISVATPDADTFLLRRTLSTPYVWAFSIFALIYSGSESTTQGFMVTYLLETRDANPKTAGYVTSGFWAAMAVTRLAWGYSSSMLSFTQRKHIVHVCILIALVMHLLIWFVDSFVQNAFACSIIGLVYGPIFPATLVAANDSVPTDIHMLGMAIISTFGNVGGALFPFTTGTLSNVFGAHVLPIVTVSQMTTLFLMHFLFPSNVKKSQFAS